MAGLIQQEMQGAAGAPAPGAAAPGQQMPDDEQMEAQTGADVGEDEGAEDENNPVFQQALTFAYEALYKNGAAKGVAQQLKSAPNLADGMADVAYNITSIIDEKTNGDVPDELLVPLAMNVLEEVGEIAEAAGMKPQPEDVAVAFKTMILRYLGEQGVDTTQLQQAMDQVDPSQFRQAADQA